MNVTSSLSPHDTATHARRRLLGTLFAGAAGTALPALALPTHRRASGMAAVRARFPNASLVSHRGDRLRFVDDVLGSGKIVVINMMYAKCTNICPPNTANLLQVRDALGDKFGRDIAFYSMTLRPEVDGPEVLADYAKQYRTGPGWTFLTGRPADMQALRRSMGFYDRDPNAEADISRHTGMALVGNVARDRWSTVPSLSTVTKIVHSLTNA